MQNKYAGYEYYANGWLKKETLPNGYSNNYTYDGAGRMTELNRLDTNGVSVLQYRYTYDNNGNRTGIVETDSDGTETVTAYEYDKLNRLIKEVNGHSGNTTEYEFDVRNNIIQKTVSGAENYTESYIYTYEHADKYMSNRITEVTKKSGDTVLGRTYYYQEANGNTYQKIVTNEYGEPVEVTDYTYNSWNLMDSASVKKGNTRTDVTYKYDATGRRNGKITEVYENGQLADSKTTEYIWYGDKVQYEEETQNSAVSPKINMWGVTGIAARNDEVFSSDAHGNTDEGYDGTTTVRRYIYDAYGNAISDNGEDDNPYRYCGENYDEETGLYYLRARYYDPRIGRFLTEDPAKDGLNWYVYCGGNPVMFVDPSGLISAVFVSSNMSGQADVRAKYYEDKYGTDAYIIKVSSAEEFVKRWNDFFEVTNEYGTDIDAIEIISHGSIEGKVGKDDGGTAYSTGFIYFTDSKKNKLYARSIEGMEDGDYSVDSLISITAKELNIEGCNTANKDTYNVVYGFMQRVNAKSYTGFDGGAQWDEDTGDHVAGGGSYVPDDELPLHAFGDNWYLVKRHQSTFWKYVPKNDGRPARSRIGRRHF